MLWRIVVARSCRRWSLQLGPATLYDVTVNLRMSAAKLSSHNPGSGGAFDVLTVEQARMQSHSCTVNRIVPHFFQFLSS
jgi:hypothetical protein